MKVRALPPLQSLCERHNHVVLLWDERIEGRALLGVGAQRSILVDTPAQEIGRCGRPSFKNRNPNRHGLLDGLATTSMKAWTSPPNQNAPHRSQRIPALGL